MDEEKKKIVMVAVIVVCVILSLGITFFSGGKKSTIQTASTLILCKSCNQSYEISYKQYEKAIVEATGTETPLLPGHVKCEKCGEAAAYRAMKCIKCGNIFVLGDAGDEKFADRCPACWYSNVEERIKSTQ